jgi:hypothetical protein
LSPFADVLSPFADVLPRFVDLLSPFADVSPPFSDEMKTTTAFASAVTGLRDCAVLQA